MKRDITPSKDSLMKKFLMMAVAAAATIGMQAQSLVFVTKDNINMRASAGTTAQIVGKARTGMVFEKGTDGNGWTEIISPDGKSAYISSRFIDSLTPDEVKVYKAKDLMVTPAEASEASYEGAYLINQSMSGGESNSSWIFYGATEEESAPVSACNIEQLTYNDGRMRTNQTFYKGVRKGWYILLTDTTDEEGKVEDHLESPIVVYPSFSMNRGAFVNGVLYPDMQDTDNWE